MNDEIQEEFELLPDFEEHVPFLMGNPKQFFIEQGAIYCVRASCDSCPHNNDGCSFVEEKIQTNVVPHARRGIGAEETSFLVLLLKEGLDFKKDVPEDLWNHSLDNYSLSPNNLHYLLSDLQKSFRVIKGQIRFYGTEEEFNNSLYCKYFDLFSEYIPKHNIVAMDLSAIEPRVSTIASREPHYMEVFKGNPKPIVREVEIKE